MKTNKHLPTFLQAGNGQNAISRFIFLSFFCAFLFCDQNAFAENTSGATSLSDKINYSVFGTLAVIFIGISVYVLNIGARALRENGKSVEFSFPTVKNMASHEKAVGILIFLLVILAIVWALKSGS